MEPDIPLKTSGEVEGIRNSCRIAAEVLRSVSAHLAAGISTLELDRIAAALLRQYGAAAGMAEGFPGTICTSVNEIAAHGVPNHRKLIKGDIITIDVAVLLDGWYGDVAASFGVDTLSAQKRILLDAARSALAAAIQVARAGCRMGDIGAAVLASARIHACVVLAEFVGHGIGRSLHEEPVVPHVGHAGEGLPVVPGMVFTIEPVLGIGPAALRRQADGWGIRNADGSPLAQFEHTVAVFSDHTEVLTAL
jgi:methionyl aminopeptidase